MWSEISDCLGVSGSGEIILVSILAISLSGMKADLLFMQIYSPGLQSAPLRRWGGGAVFKWNSPGSTSTHYLSLNNYTVLSLSICFHHPWNSPIGEKPSSLRLAYPWEHTSLCLDVKEHKSVLLKRVVKCARCIVLWSVFLWDQELLNLHKKCPDKPMPIESRFNNRIGPSVLALL